MTQQLPGACSLCQEKEGGRIALELVLGIGTWPSGFPGGTVVKNPPANAGEARDASLIPGLGRSPGEEMATYSSILAWEIPWTEESARL